LKEVSIDMITCPYCGWYHKDYEEYLEVGDMSGDFQMACEKCHQDMEVDYYSTFHFTTTRA
jgi:hypothetical protein